ncbi:MAG TPA: tetratricopeptide repeat protein [Planctomycetota bacterium]|nr:tetratricopeptide repeat protein [Planctomycetota bacterium]
MRSWRRGMGALAAIAAGVALGAGGCAGPSGSSAEARARARREALWSQASPTPVGRYDAAKTLYRRRQYAEAAFLLQRFLATYPKNALEPAALYYLAISQYYAGKRSEAVATCKRIGKDYPMTDWALFARQDLVALKAGPPEDRLREHWWHPWDWFRPDPPEVKEFNAARASFRHRDFEAALAGFRTLAERGPANPIAPAAWYYAARSYEYTAQIEKARETYQHVISAYPHTEWEWLAQDDLRRIRPE